MAEVYTYPSGDVVDVSAPAVEPVVARVRLDEATLATLDAIARHDDVWPHIHNDHSAPREEFTVEADLANPYNYFLTVSLGERVVGYWAGLSRGGGEVLEIHTVMLPDGRGKVVTAAFPKALLYWFCRTPAMTLVGRADSANYAIAKLAKWAGFRTLHTIKGGWRTKGESHDANIDTLDFHEWFRGLAGDTPNRARMVVSMLAAAGQFAKAQHIYSHYSTLLGELPTGG